jgi:hypothetical protein
MLKFGADVCMNSAELRSFNLVGQLDRFELSCVLGAVSLGTMVISVKLGAWL